MTWTDEQSVSVGGSASRSTYGTRFLCQRWSIESVGNNQVAIKAANGLNGYINISPNASDFYKVNCSVLIMSGSDNFDNNLGERLTLVPVSANTDRFIPVPNGVYRIQPRFKAGTATEDRYLLPQGDPINGNLQIAHNWNIAGNNDTNWRFERQSDWTYIITHVASNKVLAVASLPGMERLPMTHRYGVVVARNRPNNAEERWYITNSGIGFYQFTNAMNGMTYRIDNWNGARLQPGATDLLYGWFKLIKQ
jgi:hypothetical protein